MIRLYKSTAIVIFLMVTISQGAFADFGIISVQQAQDLIKTSNPLVLDTRGGYKDYISGHLPTAHHINFDTLRGTDKGVPVQYLPEDITRKLLERAGVDNSRLHILYGASGSTDEILSASMVSYVLEKYGITNVKIVDGGIDHYKKIDVLSQKYPNTPMGKVNGKINEKIAIDVQTIVNDKEKLLLVDARPENEYLGKDSVWPRKGHIPGAVNFPWKKLMEKDDFHKFTDPKTARDLLEAEGITTDKSIVVYCGTSREGSLLRFYLSHVLHYPDVRLYEGSWKEYAALEQYPAETKPNSLAKKE